MNTGPTGGSRIARRLSGMAARNETSMTVPLHTVILDRTATDRATAREDASNTAPLFAVIPERIAAGGPHPGATARRAPAASIGAAA